MDANKILLEEEVERVTLLDFAAHEVRVESEHNCLKNHGAIIRGDFTGQFVHFIEKPASKLEHIF